MKKKQFSEKLKTFFRRDDVFWNNEIQTNRLVFRVLIMISMLLVILCLLAAFGVLDLTLSSILRSTGILLAGTLLPAVVGMVLKGSRPWMKYVFMLLLIMVLAGLDILMPYALSLLMVLPVIVASRYYSRRFTIETAVMTVLIYLAMLLLSFRFGPDAAASQRPALEGFAVRLLVFLIVSFVCADLSSRGREMVLEQAEIEQKNTRINTELTLAASIQAHMLPSVFPAFPELNEFDIFARMVPAREIGGDFYDYYLLDDSRICITIADVSGKGVPASLFMAIAKILIRNQMREGLEPREAFSRVNEMLLEGNETMTFVTAWMGVIDLETGDLQYVNAGHNPPLLISKEGEVSFLRNKPELMLAGIEDFVYTQHQAKLRPGDKLLLYTDGVTECADEADAFYGEGSLKTFLEAHTDLEPRELVERIYEDLKGFAGSAEQADDITMLAFSYLEAFQKNKAE